MKWGAGYAYMTYPVQYICQVWASKASELKRGLLGLILIGCSCVHKQAGSSGGLDIKDSVALCYLFASPVYINIP